MLKHQKQPSPNSAMHQTYLHAEANYWLSLKLHSSDSTSSSKLSATYIYEPSNN